MPSLRIKTQRLKNKDQGAQTRHILLVDDDSHILNVFSEFLKQDGYQVDTANDGDLAIKQYLNARHDLIITDLFMPRVPGYELIENIRQGFPDVKIIAMSGGAPRGQTAYNLASVDKLGVQASLRKPVTRDTLLETVKTVLA